MIAQIKTTIAKIFGTDPHPQHQEKIEPEFGVNIIPTNKHAGMVVTSESAKMLETVYACIRDKSESIGQLPLVLKNNGKIVRSGRLHRILTQQPCDYLTIQDFIEFIVQSLETEGIFYALPVNNTRNNLMEIVPLRNQRSVVPNMDQAGRVYYTYVTNDGKPKMTFASGQLMVIKLTTRDGVRPMSPIRQAARAIGIALAQEDFIAHLMDEGATPKGVLTTDKIFSDAGAIARLKTEWSEFYGGSKKAGKTPVLEGGLTFTSTGLSPADSELILQRKFSVERICAIFRVPPSRVGVTDKRVFKTLEEEDRAYLKALMPLIRKIELGFGKFVPEGYTLNIDETQFARGDRKSLIEGLSTEFKHGAISINEFREGANRDPIEGGDVHAIDTNNLTFGRLEDIKKFERIDNDGNEDDVE